MGTTLIDRAHAYPIQLADFNPWRLKTGLFGVFEVQNVNFIAKL